MKRLPLFFIVLLVFLIPFEHKYDKLFRFVSLTLIPEGLELSKSFDKKIYFYLSDLIVLTISCLALFKKEISLKPFFFHPLWIVFLAAIVSILASPFFNYPLPYIRLLQLFTPFALYSYLKCKGDDKLTQYCMVA